MYSKRGLISQEITCSAYAHNSDRCCETNWCSGIIISECMFGGNIMARAEEFNLLEFQKRFGTEEACKKYLFDRRWSEGFKCPNCGHMEYYHIKTRELYECKGCSHQSSVTAGTVMHRSKLDLTVWFWAIYLVANDKRGRSALSISQGLDLNYRAAW